MLSFSAGKISKALTGLILIAAAVVCLNSSAAAQTNLKWTGCGITRLAFMGEAVKEYEKETGGKVKISLSSGGATKGIRFPNSGMADMGGTCRPALPDKFPEEELGVLLTVVAWDAIAAIVNKANPVNSLTTDQLKQILLGKITNWSQVGGPNQKILFFDREDNYSGVGFVSRIMFFNDVNTKYTKAAEALMSSGPLEENVEQNQWAIGITGVSSARKRSLKILALDGIDPTVGNISSGTYTAFRPLYIATKGKPEGEVKKFLDWLISEKGQAIVEKCGTVSLKQGAGLKTKYKYWLHTDHVVNFNLL
ncbi:MAG: phosphate ABC transporter substrate-binding protein [Deltaproteobacteria bacterium]|nr:phosphate ABC transporter substrate-binding protein [Deltaproteobacteria bacterium]